MCCLSDSINCTHIITHAAKNRVLFHRLSTLCKKLAVQRKTEAALTDMYESTVWFNAEPRLTVVTVVQLVDELKLHRYLQQKHFNFNEKSAQRRLKHCQKFSPRRRRPSRGGRPKFNQLETVITFTYKPSLVRINARNFELSW